jgi:hypothetical protein
VPAGAAGGQPVRHRLDDGIVVFTSWGAAVRAADGHVLATDLPHQSAGAPAVFGNSVIFCSSPAPDKPTKVSAWRLPAEAGDALALSPLWTRKLDGVAAGSPLVDAGLLYVVDSRQQLHVLDAKDGRPVYAAALVPAGERGAAEHGVSLMKAGGRLYAANVGTRRRTVVIEPGRTFNKLWEYAAQAPCPGAPAFEMDRHYVCAGNVLYGIAGRSPSEPVPPATVMMAPDDSLAGVDGLPVNAFRTNEVPRQWTMVGPFEPRTLEVDFLAEAGGATNVVLKADQQIRHDGAAYCVEALGTNGWFRPSLPKFTAGVKSIDVGAAVNRTWQRTQYFYTVFEFGSERDVEFHVLSPGGNIWNPKARLEARTWLSGQPIEDGAAIRVRKGRYPLMMQVAVGECESWGTIWMAPRFQDVSARFADQRRAYERAVADWPDYLATRNKLFILDE